MYLAPGLSFGILMAWVFVCCKGDTGICKEELCSSSWLKDWKSILFITVKYKSWPWRGTAAHRVGAGSTELHKAFPLADGIDFLHADRLDGKVRSQSHKWMVWYMGVDFPEAEERTKAGFWNMECRVCAPAWCSEWDQIPLLCYRCLGMLRTFPLE